MNEDQPRQGASGVSGAHGSLPDGPPFRRLRSGRRRTEPTAPYDETRGAPRSGEAATPRAGAEVPRQDDAGSPRAGAEGPRRDGTGTPRSGEAATQSTDDAGSPRTDDAGSPRPDGAATPRTDDAGSPRPDGTGTPGGGAEGSDDDAGAAGWPLAEAASEPAGPGALPAPDAPPRQGSVRARRRRRRNIVMAVLLTVFAVAVAGIVAFLQGLLPAQPEDFPGPGEGSLTFTVEQGWGPIQIGSSLEEQGVIASTDLFLEGMQSVNDEGRAIQPGEYELKYRMPAAEAARILLDADAAKVHYIAIRENMRATDAYQAIADGTGIARSELEELGSQPEKFGLKDPVTSLEGFLHPGEYRVPVDMSAQEVLQTMVDATTESLRRHGVTDPAEQYRTLKIASILQAEARPKDYRTVAGALENRLSPDNRETGGLLQIDSSVIYGLGRYSLQFTEEEKRDPANEYNTYVHRGLPPTPIGSPGDQAIAAAANPDENDYYYWVTVNTKTGETKFAETYQEHLRNQNEFRRWCADNQDVCQ